MNISNGIYKAAVWDTSLERAGLFSVCTGAGHPYWPNEDILYGCVEEYPYSYITIRSFTSHTDYVLYQYAYQTDPGYNIILVGSEANTVLSGNSIQTTITLTKPEYPDDLTIIQTIALHGTTFLNSKIEITTTIMNTGSDPVLIGVRYFLDFTLGENDGPSFQQKGPDGDVLSSERTFSPVPFQYYKMQNTTGSPAMYIMGTALGPSTLVPVPTPPDQLEFVSWNSAHAAFTYETTGLPCEDSGLLYYWGNQGGIEVPPSGSTAVTALLFENELPKLASRGVPFLP